MATGKRSEVQVRTPRGKKAPRQVASEDSASTPQSLAVEGAVAVEKAPRFGDILRRKQRESGKRRKGQRTRDRLKVAAIAALGDLGFRRLRVSDICKRAKVSSAAFYLYFKNKKEITVEVLTEFLDSLAEMSKPAEGRTRTVYEAIYELNLSWISAVRANSGLMRCLLQLSDETPGFKALNERTGHEWYVRVAHNLVGRFPEAHLDEKVVLLAIYALGGMMDDISRRLLVAREPHLHALVGDVAPTDEAFAEFLSILWFRALFAAEPAEMRSRAARELQQIARVDPRRLDDGVKPQAPLPRRKA